MVSLACILPSEARTLATGQDAINWTHPEQEINQCENTFGAELAKGCMGIFYSGREVSSRDLEVFKPISGRVRIACFGLMELMTTSLVQVVNRLDTS